jgi:hypothetical protein
VVFSQKFGEAFCGLGNNNSVHSIWARAQFAPESGRSKFKALGEARGYFGDALGFHQFS